MFQFRSELNFFIYGIALWRSRNFRSYFKTTKKFRQTRISKLNFVKEFCNPFDRWPRLMPTKMVHSLWMKAGYRQKLADVEISVENSTSIISIYQPIGNLVSKLNICFNLFAHYYWGKCQLYVYDSTDNISCMFMLIALSCKIIFVACPFSL